MFRVQEAAQVEDDRQEEHEARHGDHRHRLFTGERAAVGLTPQTPRHVHLEREVENKRKREREGRMGREGQIKRVREV